MQVAILPHNSYSIKQHPMDVICSTEIVSMPTRAAMGGFHWFCANSRRWNIHRAPLPGTRQQQNALISFAALSKFEAPFR